MSQVSELIAYIQKRIDCGNDLIEAFRTAKNDEYSIGREHAYKEILEYIEDYFDGV